MHKIIWGLALLIGLAGCGHKPVAIKQASLEKSVAAASRSFFPVEHHFVWQYDVVAHPADDPYTDYKGTETVRLSTVRRSGDNQILEMKAIDSFTNRYRFPVVEQNAQGVRILGVTYWGAAASDADDLRIDFLRFPLRLASKWDDGQWVTEVKTKERVTVPCGTFEAWKLSVIGTYQQNYTAVGSYWVAPGIGIVKSALSIPGWDIESELILGAVQAP